MMIELFPNKYIFWIWSLSKWEILESTFLGYKSGKLKPKSSKNEIIENTENNDISLGLEEGLVISKATGIWSCSLFQS